MRIIVYARDWLELWGLKRKLRKAAPKAEIAGFRTHAGALSYLSKNLADAAFIEIAEHANEQIFAGQLQKINPRINIIFVSAEADCYCMASAFEMFASGFLIKPFGVRDVEAEFQNLRYPPPDT